jgi:hypothetical protein
MSKRQPNCTTVTTEKVILTGRVSVSFENRVVGQSSKLESAT